MLQPTNEENKVNEELMLKHLNSKYDRTFNSSEYHPADRGYNDSHSKNILVAESEDGIVVNVRESVGNKGNYSDNYANAYASKLIDEKVDFSSVRNMQYSKIHVTLFPETVNMDFLRNKDATITNAMVINLYSLIFISSEANDEILEQLYDEYVFIQSLGYERNNFIVAFAGDSQKAKNYVHNYPLYGIQAWENYDNSIKQILRISENELSFEQFRDFLLSIEG